MAQCALLAADQRWRGTATETEIGATTEPSDNGVPTRRRCSRSMADSIRDADRTTPLPLGPTPRFVTENFDVPGIDQIEVYRAHGGYEALAKALRDFQPDELVEEVKKSGLRGRGGAGFPTGMKWSFLPKESPKPRYLCVNGDESEPGTFKDRMIMEVSPHLLVEGIDHRLPTPPRCTTPSSTSAANCSTAAHAGGARRARGVRGGLPRQEYPRQRLRPGHHRPSRRGRLHLRRGERAAGVAGGQARLSAPQAAVPGGRRPLWRPDGHQQRRDARHVPPSCAHGAAVYAAYGTEKSKGTRVYCLSGHVNRPGNYELPLGTPLRTLIEDFGGGVRGGKQLKAIIPGGSSTPIPDADAARYAAGLRVGRGGWLDARLRRVIVLDDETCIVGAVLRMTEFYRDESCGKCTPCREGTFWLVQLLERLEAGARQRERHRPADRHLRQHRGQVVLSAGRRRDQSCIVSSIKLFRDEYIHHVRAHGCLVGPGARAQARARVRERMILCSASGSGDMRGTMRRGEE